MAPTKQSSTNGTAQLLALSAMLPPPGFGAVEPASEEKVASKQMPTPEKVSIRPPPGLELDAPDVEPPPGLENGKLNLGLPPGLLLQKSIEGECDGVGAGCGLAKCLDAEPVKKKTFSLADCLAAESDETSAGSTASAHSQSSDSENEMSSRQTGLVLAEKSQLKGNAPMFQPMLSSNTPSTALPAGEQRTPLRAALRSKADAFVPTGLGLSAVLNAEPYAYGEQDSQWEEWDGTGADGDEWNGVAEGEWNGVADGEWNCTADSEWDGSTTEGLSAYGISSNGSFEFYAEQEWSEGW